jgi:putative spermidine/putrescine transport system ATP-binding protein
MTDGVGFEFAEQTRVNTSLPRDPAHSLGTSTFKAPCLSGDPAPYVRFAGVYKTYDGKTAVVDDLNLDIGREEFVTLLGPSGSGKTTTLMMLAGFEPLNRGQIFVDNIAIQNLAPHKRQIGMVFQNYALFPHMSVGENLGFPLRARNVSKPEIATRIQQALDTVRLSDLKDRRPSQLSGGQQQRVALARALIFEPKIVLMDEPLGALDKNLREQMQAEIKRIHDILGITVIYVTHDQAEALALSNRVAVFNKGRIEQIASPQELYQAPRTSFVATFIGESNQIPGRIDAFEGSACRVELENGQKITAQAAETIGLHDHVLLSIRPEHVIIGRGATGVGRFDAVVQEITYLGDHRRVRLALFDQTNFIAKAFRDEEQRLSPGDRVTVSWQAEHCRALLP